jgi:hypothetical protein
MIPIYHLPPPIFKGDFFWTKTLLLANQHDFFLLQKNQSFLQGKKQKIIDYMKLKKTESTRVALSCSKQDNEFIMAKLCLFFKF